jgi:hypothetical protein
MQRFSTQGNPVTRGELPGKTFIILHLRLKEEVLVRTRNIGVLTPNVAVEFTPPMRYRSFMYVK